MTGSKGVRRWPLLLIAAPAAVAVWSGWVGLGALCGFGVVHPLPGIADGLRLNTAITLPVGVESYGAYALGAWLTPGTPEAARRFARRSALGALGLGMAGQVIYHLLAAAGAARAPWPVVVLVSCLPVVTLGLAGGLTHLLRVQDQDQAADAEPALAVLPLAAGHGPEPVPPGMAALNGHAERALELFAADLDAGRVPGIRAIRSGLHVGQGKAQQVQAYLRTRPRTPAAPEVRD